jgi:hypothetical protein
MAEEKSKAYAEAARVPEEKCRASRHDLYWMRQYLELAKDCAERGLHLLDLIEGNRS